MDKAWKAGHHDIPDSTKGWIVYFSVFFYSLGLSMQNDEVGPVVKTLHSHRRPRGPMDKASDYESGDSRFESWRGRVFLFCF